MKIIKNIYFWSVFLTLLIQGAQGYSADFNDLSVTDQDRVRAGELFIIPVKMDRKKKLLDGTFFRYVKKVQPEQFAAVFYDYDHQFTFVPGMNLTQILEEEGRKAWVTHRINPLIFIQPNVKELLPPELFDAGTYTYNLDEVLCSEGRKYAVKWSIPEDQRSLGANEVGRIQFEPFGEGKDAGTLITYENGTLPFLYRYLFLSRTHPHLEAFLSGPAQRYYIATINNLVTRTLEVIRTGEIKEALQRLESGLKSGPSPEPMSLLRFRFNF